MARDEHDDMWTSYTTVDGRRILEPKVRRPTERPNQSSTSSGKDSGSQTNQTTTSTRR